MDTTIENMINSIDLSAPVPEYEPMRQYYYLKACRKIVKEKSEALNRPLTAVVSTFGCQMNARDSEKLLGILKDIGYQESDDEENADFVIYNTCTVRENANLRVYGRLGQLKKVKRANGEMIIAMCGCMMQEPEVVEKIKTSYKFVDIVFGTFNIFKLAELMYMCFTGDEQVIDIWDSTKEVVEELPTSRKYPFKSGVNIMFGCNNFCTYCIVPYVRGREKSREPKEIIREIERLVSDGVKEVMLLGQNVNSYGKTLDDNVTFAELLREIAKIDGLERIRFMTPHPKDLSDELIEAIRDNSKICNHIHLPLQSGSSRLLKLMNRQYTKEHYLELVDKIRNTIPDISITTDIIVGFPGETEEDFEDTLDVVRKAKYDSAYTFIYSKRTGTPAAKMDGQVSEDIVKDRFNRLLATVSEVSHEHIKRYEGMDMDVLVEDIDDHDNTFVTGRMTNNILADVIEHCNELRTRYGYDKLDFYVGDIATYKDVDKVDMVVTLHACDTATDYALAKAVKWGAEVILSVPCCQHEANRTIKSDILSPVMDYGILKERMAAIVTDAARAKLLTANGYDTQILEFIDMEHTPKNLLIRAVKSSKEDISAREKTKDMLEALNLELTIDKLI